MAYGQKYKCGFSSADQTGWVYIYEDGYGGAVEELVTRSESVKIRYNWKGWEEPIIGLTASFTIVNTKDNFFTLLPLLTAEERKYWIKIERVSPSSLVMFEGFLNCEDNEQKYLKRQDIRLNASSYLSKLQYVYAPTIEVLENDTFINIIDDCLTQTGASDNIRINCSLYATGDTLAAGQTLFNKNAVYKEVFWKNNVDRDSALDVIKKILTTFDCYIYWYNEYWYIERYADIWNNPQNYVEYTSNTSPGYGPGDAGTPVQTTDNPVDFKGMIPLERSQLISMIIGQKQVEVNIEQQLMFNLIINNFEGATAISGVVPYPDYRQWQYWDPPGSDINWDQGWLPYKNIARGIHRYLWEESAPDVYATQRGIYTRFRTTMSEQTVFTIKFKVALINAPGASWPDNYDVDFHWYLRNPVGNYFIMHEDSDDTWHREETTEVMGLQTITIPASEFDQSSYTVEVSITIPFEDIVDSSWYGDQDFVFCIGTELVNYYGGGGTSIPEANIWYGDVEITATAELTDNYYSGDINTNFLNKKTIELPFSDIADLSIKNGIFRGTNLDIRTDTWEDGESLAHTLAEIKIRDKFRLYNKSRQKITADVKDVNFYKPLSLFEDTNQAGLCFILMGYGYSPQDDRMGLELSEYDNTDTINLI